VNVTSDSATVKTVSVDVDMRHVLSVFVCQLRLLLGIHSMVLADY